MPDPLSRRWRTAVYAVRNRLAAFQGSEPVALSPKTVASYNHQWRIVAGWRLIVDFGEPVPRRIDVLIPAGFPNAWPRFALVDRPAFLSWPHVERDGIMCLLSNMTEIDVDDPAGVVIDLLGRACRLVRDLIAGPMVERDLREEFLTYWRYDRNAADGRLISILRPEGPTREIAVWQGKHLRLLGETEADVVAWVANRFGAQPLRPSRIERAILLWLDEAMLPADYPRTAKDILALAERAGVTAARTLVELILAGQDRLECVIGSDGRHGPGLVCVTVPSPGHGNLRHGTCVDPLSRGFRPRTLPVNLRAGRFLGAEPVRRDEPSRADAAWIHGRGQDPRTARLLNATATVMGCGSVGAPVAVALAQAGVGRINLVDPDALAWSNVGRHPLGAASVRQNKAEALAAKLRADYPHGRFQAFPLTAQAMLADGARPLLDSSVVVSAMGDWRAESRVNDWHCQEDRPMPVVYGWTEAHAVAGHAVAVMQEGGCLRCGLGRTGVPHLRVAAWSNGASGALEEPACGAHYQPYGPVELGFVTSLVAQTALDCLLGKIHRSTHRVYAARRALVAEVGGRWSEEWLRAYPGLSEGGAVVEREWSAAPCARCSGSLAA